jgi:hypothetical protein
MGKSRCGKRQNNSSSASRSSSSRDVTDPARYSTMVLYQHDPAVIGAVLATSKLFKALEDSSACAACFCSMLPAALTKRHIQCARYNK